MDGPETARRAGLSQGLLLNDFEAQALSLPAIPEAWARRIGPLAFASNGPQVILGPGTGLGVAALVEADGRFTPVSSEACHIDFGPVSPEEFALWPHLERAHGRVTSESVISGAGLARVHRARMMALGQADPHLGPPGVTAAAEADPRGEAAASLRLFWRIVARFAGDMAVTFVATGGLTLSGGVLPRLVDFLDEATFRDAFEAKAPVDGLARRIPTRLVTGRMRSWPAWPRSPLLQTDTGSITRSGNGFKPGSAPGMALVPSALESGEHRLDLCTGVCAGRTEWPQPRFRPNFEAFAESPKRGGFGIDPMELAAC